MLIENPMLVCIETRRRHFRRHRDPDRITHPLAQRPGRALDPRSFKKLRMTGCLAVQLPETLDLRHRQIVAAQVQPGIEEHAPVTGRENEKVAIDPSRLVWIVSERVAIEYGAHLGAA